MGDANSKQVVKDKSIAERAAEMRETVRAKRAAVVEEKKAARDLEYVEHVGPLLLEDPDYIHHELELVDPSLPGHVVCRPATDPEISRLKHIIAREPSQRGAVEAKARAGAELALNCVIYPERKRYLELISKYALVPEVLSAAIIKHAEAAAVEKGKE